jgi:hypothetical protein
MRAGSPTIRISTRLDAWPVPPRTHPRGGGRGLCLCESADINLPRRRGGVRGSVRHPCFAARPPTFHGPRQRQQRVAGFSRGVALCTKASVLHNVRSGRGALAL